MGLNEAALRELGEITCWGVFTTDRDLRITGWNRWMELHSALPASSVMGRNLCEVFPEVVTRRIDRFYRQVIEGQMVVLSQRLHRYIVPLPATVPGAEGSLMQQRGHIAPLMLNEETVGTLTLIEDVSDRVFYESELRTRALRQEAIASLSQKALSGDDAGSLFQDVVRETLSVLNLQYCRIVELDPEGTPAVRAEAGACASQSGSRGDPASRTLFRQLLAAREPLSLREPADERELPIPPAMLERGIRCGLELPLRAGDHFRGSLGAYSSAAGCFAPDEVQFLQSVVNVLGMTLQRQFLEAELRGHVEQLADADRRKDEFLAMLGHELRNPLAPIRHAVALLSVEGLEPEISSEARAIIDRQVAHLVRLVDDLLDVSRILRGRIELRMESVELQSVINRAIETSQPLIFSHGHKLSISLPSEPLHILADPVRLSQVVSNLLNNAAKYTENGGEIEIAVERSGARVIIRVRDNGMGIDPEFLPHIFDVFRQADRSIARSEGGLGIGLTLVKSLIQMHGGTVTAHSAGLGTGSEFTLRLPIVESIAPSGKDVFHPVPMRPLRILVVDDQVGSAVLLSKLLSRFWNHEVQVANEGSRAIELAEEFHPEVVLLDIGLPGMSGLEVASRLRQLPSMASALLVALTGYGQLEDRDRSREAGFDEHLVKPASVHDLQRLFLHRKLA